MSFKNLYLKTQRYSFILLLLISGISCSSGNDQENNKQLEKGELSYEKVLEISNNSDSNEDSPLLSFAANITSDSNGNIFIYDSGSRKIFVYDDEGNFMHSFARKGSGPGEIGQLSTIYVDSRDRLITSDRKNARITAFNTEGEVLQSTSSLGINSIRNIREMPDGRYLLTGWDGDHFLHITDSEFENIESSFGKISDFEKDIEDFEQRWFQRISGVAQPVSNKTVVFAPLYYQGVVYIYEPTVSGSWELSTTADGYRNIENYVNFTSSEPESYHGVSFGPDGKTYIGNKTLSLGFYQQDDELVHLSRLKSGGPIELIVERFNSRNLELQRYYTSDKLELGRSSRRNIRWMDNQNKIFVADNSDIPKVEVLQILDE